MALKLRLARAGAKKRPFYRIVVAEAASPRDGRFVEKVGTYNPMVAKDHPQRLTLVEDRIRHWLSVGAKPTERVSRFLGEAKIIDMPAVRETPNQSKPKKKALERLQEKEEKVKAAEEAAKAEAEAAKEAEKAAAEAAKAEAEAAKEAEKAEEEKPAEEAPKEEAAAEPASAEEKPAEESKKEDA